MAIETSLTLRALAPAVGRPAPDRALAEAHTQFAARYPEWAASLFDEFFVEHHLRPMLAWPANERRGLAADPAAVAQAWAGQFSWRSAGTRQRRVAELVPAAAQFLRWVEEAPCRQGRAAPAADR